MSWMSTGILGCAFAEPALADRLIPQLTSGAWTATMCMTEAQAGSDLTRITTRATAR